jgi:hypothetical protein
MSLPPFWQLIGFAERLDVWAAEQGPSDQLVNVVVQWVYSRYDDPYADVQRQPQDPNYWWGSIPGTIHGEAAVVCGYWIFETDRIVRCDNFATLSLPL